MNDITKVSKKFHVHSIITLTLKKKSIYAKNNKHLLKNQKHILLLLSNEVDE
jgi:hypothetical protein